ncbi:LysR family transcriptional regulator [Vibrio parahaemolyticus]|nr:LysR family transcriptional regulator [Vibrio parahaemolyticus]
MCELNLNLINTFLIIYEKGNLTKAAETLGVTQPRMSYQLKQLRSIYNDSLFIRKGYGIEPTSTARNLYPILREAIDAVRNTIPETTEFVPHSTTMTLTIAATSFANYSFLTDITNEIQKSAPNCLIKILNTQENMTNLVKQKQIDIILDVQGRHPELAKHDILHCNLLAFESKLKPSASKPMTLERYLEEKHLVYSPETHNENILNDSHSKYFNMRKPARQLPMSTEFTDTLYNSNWITTLPDFMGTKVFDKEKFVYHPLPFQYKKPVMTLYWDPSRTADKTNIWLRQFFLDT